MTSLVLGANGFLGSHVTRLLAESGEVPRILVRPTSSTRALDGLDVDRRVGDVFDPETLRSALDGVGDVYYCVVDARPWLRDPSPMWRTNVAGLRTVLDVVKDVRRFVFTSSIATLATNRERLVTEDDPHNWDGGPYVASRVEAERLVLEAARERGLPAVAMCVANTYGEGDHLPTPHGAFVLLAARGKLPFYVRGAAAEVVAVDDAARALVLAAERARPGERYAVAERWMTMREIAGVAATEAGVVPPRYGVPTRAMAAAGFVGEQVARVARRDLKLTRTTARLMHVMTPVDRTKAVRELGWSPRPTPDAIREATRFYLRRRR